MKVRHEGRIYEQVGEWKHPCGTYFRVLETAHEFKLVPSGGVFDTCKEIEEAPRWQDVTGECEFTEGCLRFSKDGTQYVLASHPGYRLRKVRVRKLDDEVIAGIPHQSLQWAFLVERKVDG